MVFPATSRFVNAELGTKQRHHLHERTVQRAFKDAVPAAAIAKHATLHCLRHSFATHALMTGYDMRTVQGLLGRRHLETTMTCTHVLNRGGRGCKSPADLLWASGKDPVAYQGLGGETLSPLLLEEPV